MSVAKFARSKPHTNLIIMGDSGHGKTMLAAAIHKVTHDLYQTGEAFTYESLQAEEQKAFGIVFRKKTTEFETADRHYSLTDFDSTQDMLKALTAGAAMPDAAIIACRWNEGLNPAYVHYAAKFGIRQLAVYFGNENEEYYDEELADLAQMQAVDLLEEYFYEPLVFHGDSKAAYDDPQSAWGFSILELADSLNEEAIRADHDPVFLMPVSDVLTIVDRRLTCASGRIIEGSVTNRNIVEVLGFGEVKTTTVSGISMLGKVIDDAYAGDNVTLSLRGIKVSELRRGQVLASPGAVKQYTRFKAFLYVMDANEGNNTPLVQGETLSCYLYTTDIPCRLSGETELLLPGTAADMTVSLITPMPIKTGTHFSIRRNEKVAAAGIVTEIIE